MGGTGNVFLGSSLFCVCLSSEEEDEEEKEIFYQREKRR
jgi:hypothetical protein